jgi:hypothetical protein
MVVDLLCAGLSFVSFDMGSQTPSCGPRYSESRVRECDRITDVVRCGDSTRKTGKLPRACHAVLASSETIRNVHRQLVPAINRVQCRFRLEQQHCDFLFCNGRCSTPRGTMMNSPSSIHSCRSVGAVSGSILLSSTFLDDVLRQWDLTAIERLMGMSLGDAFVAYRPIARSSPHSMDGWGWGLDGRAGGTSAAEADTRTSPSWELPGACPRPKTAPPCRGAQDELRGNLLDIRPARPCISEFSDAVSKLLPRFR